MQQAIHHSGDAPAAMAFQVGEGQRDECEECVGSGGWYRYEPSLEPAPGMLYLSCLQCRGTGFLRRLSAN